MLPPAQSVWAVFWVAILRDTVELKRGHMYCENYLYNDNNMYCENYLHNKGPCRKQAVLVLAALTKPWTHIQTLYLHWISHS